MTEELLKLGDSLSSVWGPSDSMDGQVGASIAGNVSAAYRAESITVGQLPGPMGWYLVAVVRWRAEKPDMIFPLHMMESFSKTVPAQ